MVSFFVLIQRVLCVLRVFFFSPFRESSFANSFSLFPIVARMAAAYGRPQALFLLNFNGSPFQRFLKRPVIASSLRCWLDLSSFLFALFPVSVFLCWKMRRIRTPLGCAM